MSKNENDNGLIRVSLYIRKENREFYELLKRSAKRNRRSMSAHIIHLCEVALRLEGEEVPEPQ